MKRNSKFYISSVLVAPVGAPEWLKTGGGGGEEEEGGRITSGGCSWGRLPDPGWTLQQLPALWT